jgi:very-short-patch-repair endonuclease/DNA polymerase III delta prime subunit
MTNIDKQLQDARQKLLDLTMFNRLLNFRPTKTNSIRVIDEIPREIYNVLVLQEKTMKFIPKPKTQKFDTTTDNDEQDQENEISNSSEDEASKLWDLPPLDTELADRYIDSFLQTPLESDDLQKKLFHISQHSRSVLEDQGYTILYLALGFLEWTESPSSNQSRRAPLILVPVELTRTKVGTSFKLCWTGEDIFTNISLQAKLNEQSITLPSFEMSDEKNDIANYFQDVVNATSVKPEWKVLSDIYLGFFSFTKFVMYKDIDLKCWPEGKSPANQPLIREIFNPSDIQTGSGFSENEVDKKLNMHDLYHVMDADPSQIAVIEDVKAGRNLVVEGPPGTGKSQTITNIIAELLATGKTVLFVSEKMAALEVVKSRLDQVGLGDFCLELHSRKSNKKEVLKELERTISRPAPRSISLDEDYDKLDAIKTELNTYAETLNEPFGKLGQSIFTLFCMKENALQHFADVERTMPRIKIFNIEECNQSELNDAVSALADIAEVLSFVKPISNNPWRGCMPSIILPSDEIEIEQKITECKKSLSVLNTAINQMAKTCAIHQPTTLQELQFAISAAKVIASSKPVDRDVLLNQEWNSPNDVAPIIIQKVETLQNQQSLILSKFTADALDQDINSMLKEYKDFSSKFFIFKIFNSNYFKLKHAISSLYNDVCPKSTEKTLLDLEELRSYIQLRMEFKEFDQAGQALFGLHWQSEESDPQILQSFANWIVSFRQLLLNDAFNEQVIDILSTGISQEQVEKTIVDVNNAKELFIEEYDQLAQYISADYELVFGTHADNISFNDFAHRFEIWESTLPQLQRWALFVTRRKVCQNTIAAPIIETINTDLLEPEDIIPCFKGNFADDLLRCAFIERPILANFIGELHENKINNFMELDRKLIVQNRQRLAYMLYQNQPHNLVNASKNSEVGILLGEFNRKRKHMPIRKLMSLTGGLIQKIKPCFMMSPLSIAQFLDPKTINFDVVIFDEASQVKPEDALGAFLRGDQGVVIGDTRQLPPTSFFDHIIESNEGNDPEQIIPIADVESILHLCKRSFQTKTLRWHYRSRHESLVAVSNQEFYDNQLVIYPSPIDNPDYLGLKLMYLPDTIYDRGHSSINRKEAIAVAKATIDHYRQFPDKSLGVGTFNIKQQQAILEEVDLQLREHPEMEKYYKSNCHEHFFVKNLETIQGDERDVILLSIGFGFDKFRRLNLNFGALNNEGGERRLNVLITRAREQCIVFSNFHARDLPLNANASFGLRALKVFLDFAENRNLHSIEATGEDTDSPFEDAVYNFLRDYGYEVHKQIGCAGYKVDLAIVDSRSPGCYLLGIECDGAKYHSSPVARERDRLRQQILENLGWKIYRVWSTDWYRNRTESERKLLDAVEKVKHTNLVSIGVQQDTVSSTIQVTEEDIKYEDCVNDRIIDVTLDETIPDYEKCSYLEIETKTALYELPIEKLVKMVVQIVKIESPVHYEEVIRRIRFLYGLKRTGMKIRNAINKAIDFAEHEGEINKNGDFLWSGNSHTVHVRRRCGDIPTKIDLICDEEIAEAIKLIINNQFATEPDDLIVQSSRLFGIRTTSKAVVKRIKNVIDKLIYKKELQFFPNGMINFVSL